MKTPIKTPLSANCFKSRRNHMGGGREPPRNDDKCRRNGGFERFWRKSEKWEMLVFFGIFWKMFTHCLPICLPTFGKCLPRNKNLKQK